MTNDEMMERIKQLEEGQDTLLNRIRALEETIDELDSTIWHLKSHTNFYED